MRLVGIENWHAIDWTVRIGSCHRIDYIIGANHQSDIRLGELGIDFIEIINLVVFDTGFSQQHIHVPRHATGDRVNRIFNMHTARLQQVFHFLELVLCLGDSHAITGNDNDIISIGHHDRCILRLDFFHAAFDVFFHRCTAVTAEAAEQYVGQ